MLAVRAFERCYYSVRKNSVLRARKLRFNSHLGKCCVSHCINCSYFYATMP